MGPNDERQAEASERGDKAEAGATEEAKVLFGDRAAKEKHEQPSDTETVTLDSDTIVSPTPAPARGEE